MNAVFRDEEPKHGSWRINPPFDRRHLKAIELGLRAAWDRLLKDPEKARELTRLDEVHISHLLRDELNEIRERGNVADGYNCDLFEKPQIGAETLSNDGEIRKPDIVFSLCGGKRPGVEKGMTDCIFVECKIIEQGNRNVAAYCKKGLNRFVEGAYAPWMPEGMMLAYVRSTQELPDDLQQYLDTADMREVLATDGKLRVCSLNRRDPRVQISIHARQWSHKTGGEPGPIEVRHLWLHV